MIRMSLLVLSLLLSLGLVGCAAKSVEVEPLLGAEEDPEGPEGDPLPDDLPRLSGGAH
jgi:hypothetical protein